MEKKPLIACEVLYLVSCIYSDNDYKRLSKYEKYINEAIDLKGARSLNYLRKIDIRSYAFIIESIKNLYDKLPELLISNN